jgi:hypothetical protein
MSIHVVTAEDAPSIVVTTASAARPFAASAEPALKPNQPNHSSDAPRMTNGTLCGPSAERRSRRRGPRISAATSAIHRVPAP